MYKALCNAFFASSWKKDCGGDPSRGVAYY